MGSYLKPEDIATFEYIDVDEVYDIEVENDHNYFIHSGKEILVHNSSKSFSLAQLFTVLPFEKVGSRFSVVRKSMPSLRATAMRDFIGILKSHEIYKQDSHNKTENIYNLNGCEIEFIGLDDPQKVRSRRRDYLWINEANELSLESFRQLNMRTDKKVFLDFNPSDEFHWIYDHVLTRDDCELIKSTYKDNPFLPVPVVKEIERYKDVDDNYWKVYGLGERGASQVRIYTRFNYIDDLPSGEMIYGLDFGFNHPTSLSKVVLNDGDVYVKEIIHESYLTNQDLISKMIDLEIDKNDYIYADSEDPNRIEELQQAGFNVIPATKGKDSVKAGIDMIKSRKLSITKDSVNGIKELQSYSWKTKGEVVLDQPVKLRDDFVDSVRYAVFSHLSGVEADFDFV